MINYNKTNLLKPTFVNGGSNLNLKFIHIIKQGCEWMWRWKINRIDIEFFTLRDEKGLLTHYNSGEF